MMHKAKQSELCTWKDWLRTENENRSFPEMMERIREDYYGTTVQMQNLHEYWRVYTILIEVREWDLEKVESLQSRMRWGVKWLLCMWGLEKRGLESLWEHSVKGWVPGKGTSSGEHGGVGKGLDSVLQEVPSNPINSTILWLSAFSDTRCRTHQMVFMGPGFRMSRTLWLFLQSVEAQWGLLRDSPKGTDSHGFHSGKLPLSRGHLRLPGWQNRTGPADEVSWRLWGNIRRYKSAVCLLSSLFPEAFWAFCVSVLF